MKVKLNKCTYILLVFFITTIGNSSWLTSKGLNEIVTYFGIALLLLGIVVSRYKNRQCNKNSHKVTYKLFFVVEFFFSIGIIMQDISVALKIKLLLTMFFVAAFALLSDDFIFSLKAARYAAYGVLLAVIITTGLAIVGGEPVSSIAVEGVISSFGFNGGLQHKNYFACAMLAILSIMYLCNRYEKKTESNRVVIIISAILLIVSNSRGSLIIAFIFFVICHYDSLLRIKKNQRRLFVIASVCIAIIGVGLVYSFYLSDSGSYMIRMRGLTNYIEIYKEDMFHMWFGNAEMAWKDGNYNNNVKSVIGWNGTLELSFLSILIKNGIFGYFGYLIIFVFYIKKGLTAYNWKLKSMILSLSFSLLSSAFVENYIINTHVIYGIFIYCVICGLIGQNEKNKYNYISEIENGRGKRY